MNTPQVEKLTKPVLVMLTETNRDRLRICAAAAHVTPTAYCRVAVLDRIDLDDGVRALKAEAACRTLAKGRGRK